MVMADNDLDWLMNWYVRACNGDWEHTYGIKIDTLDNPGWLLEIDLKETPLEGLTFESRHGEPAADLQEWRELGSWWTAKANGRHFTSACGPTDLEHVIKVFRKWAESLSR